MKVRETALRLKRFEAEEKTRRVKDIEFMIREFSSMAGDLDRQIRAEEERTAIRDPKHFSYSTFAKSLSARRDNLRISVDELHKKHEAAIKDRDEAMEQLARAEATLLSRDMVKPIVREKESLETAVLR